MEVRVLESLWGPSSENICNLVFRIIDEPQDHWNKVFWIEDKEMEIINQITNNTAILLEYKLLIETHHLFQIF